MFRNLNVSQTDILGSNEWGSLIPKPLPNQTGIGPAC